MTKEELWRIYCERNPRFSDASTSVCFTSAGLRKFFEETYRHAFAAGSEATKKTMKLPLKDIPVSETPQGKSLFEKFFGA